MNVSKSYFKLAFLFFLTYVALSVVIYSKTRDYAVNESEKKIENILLMHKAIHGYVEEVQKPVIYKLKKEGKLYNEFFAPEILSFTFIARGIKDEYNKQRVAKKHEPIYFKLASDNPRNSVNQADARELSILKKVNENNISQIKDVLEEGGKKYLYVALPVQANKASCMKCHSTPDVAPTELLARYGDKAGFYESEGKIRAIISIKASLEDELKAADRLFYIISTALFVAMFCIYIVTLYFMSKLASKESIIGQKNAELTALNETLEQKVQSETAKLLEKEKLLIQQTKMAMMGEMIGAIAHQWRQPLNSLGITVQDISYAYEYGELDKEYLEKFKNESMNTINTMSRTIEDFRNFFSPTKKAEQFYIEDAIEETLRILSSQLKVGGIEVLFDSNIADKHQFVCFKNELKQVILNILANAKDALLEKSSANKFIKIVISNKNDAIEIGIEDSAGGIPIDIIDKVFEPNFTTKEVGKGTGIGLYMSKEIIEDHLYGKISVENTENGARFTIWLPSTTHKL